uniref:Uncharacterized protein n=1 Tax=Candidatus Kentrum sp. DK TaxID=2126562 RepID=A0A450SVU2_9GAMM|nr:MAG: hypothetical protein BECKDK2373B_GA0170837_10719 [Candidatus Kentron sp. DK]
MFGWSKREKEKKLQEAEQQRRKELHRVEEERQRKEREFQEKEKQRLEELARQKQKRQEEEEKRRQIQESERQRQEEQRRIEEERLRKEQALQEEEKRRLEELARQQQEREEKEKRRKEEERLRKEQERLEQERKRQEEAVQQQQQPHEQESWPELQIRLRREQERREKGEERQGKLVGQNQQSSEQEPQTWAEFVDWQEESVDQEQQPREQEPQTWAEFFQELCPSLATEAAMDAIHERVQKNPLTLDEIRDIKLDCEEFFDDFFRKTAHFDKLNRNLALILTWGIGDDRAVMALFHHVTGLEDSPQNRDFLKRNAEVVDKEQLWSMLEHYQRRSQESHVNPPANVKQAAMPVLLKVTQDTRALSLIGYRCQEQYEADVAVRRTAIIAFKEYCLGLRTGFRPENPFLILRLLQPVLQDTGNTLRALVLETIQTVLQHTGHEALRLLLEQQERETDPEIRAQLVRQLAEILNQLPSGAGSVILNIAQYGLFDAEVVNRKQAIAQLFSEPAWAVFCAHATPEDITGLFGYLAQFVVQEIDEEVKNDFLGKLQGEFVFFKLNRADQRDEFARRYQEEMAPGVKPTDLDGRITLLQKQSERLLRALRREILREDGFYSNAVETVKALKELAGRNDRKVRRFLCMAFRHFERQGQTFPDEAFEKAIDPKGFLNLPCEGKQCVLKEEEINAPVSEIPSYSVYSYNDYDIRSFPRKYVQFKPTCDFSPNTPTHLVGHFYNSGRCFGVHPDRKEYPHEKDWKGIQNWPQPFDVQTYIAQSDKRIRLSETGLDSLSKLAELGYLGEDISGYDQLAVLNKTVYETVYQKQFTAKDAKKLLPQPNPERQLVMEILAAMKALCIGDAATQEFLFAMLGQNQDNLHWHEDTRIRLIETIATITRGEPLNAHKGQEALFVLALVEARPAESDAVKQAATRARATITERREWQGAMVLAPDWPVEGKPL